jgi:tetratricopeptide (TPR) repeat protein
MTVSPRGVSTSAGGKGYRVTKSASGRVTRTVSLPGTGMRHTKTLSSASKRRTSATRTPQSQPAAAPPPKSGLLSPKWEKELFGAVSKQKWDSLARISHDYPEAAPVAVTLDGLLHLEEADLPRTVELLRWAWAYAGEVENHQFVRKYIGSSHVRISIADGVSAMLPISRDAIGLALAEVEQSLGNINAAIEIVEHLDPSHIAAVSLCELYSAASRYDGIIDVTNGITNEDDATALLLAFRGEAFREQGMNTAALESLKEALKSSKRDPAIRHRALLERASAYIADGKKAQARKDLERILAENSDYEGVRGLIASLSN